MCGVVDVVNTFIDLHKRGDRGLVVCVKLSSRDNFDDDAEFIALVGAANIEQVYVSKLTRAEPMPKYLIGRGQVDELAKQVENNDINVVLFNRPLTPAQGRNLERLFDCRVIDRNELILDIFAVIKLLNYSFFCFIVYTFSFWMFHQSYIMLI